MATLDLSYYGGVAYGVGSAPMGTERVTTTATTSPRTSNPGAQVVSLFGDADHYIAIGESPDATGSERVRIPANTLVWINLPTEDSQVDAVTT